MCLPLATASDSLLSPKGVNYEGLALQDLKPKVPFSTFLYHFVMKNMNAVGCFAWVSGCIDVSEERDEG